MEYSDIGTVAAWLTEQGLKGASEAELMTGFCYGCRDAGLPLDRGLALMDTLHPVHEGRAFRWDSQEEIEAEFEYGPTELRGSSLEAGRSRPSIIFGPATKTRYAGGSASAIRSISPCSKRCGRAGHTDFVAMVHRLPRPARSARWTASSRISRQTSGRLFRPRPRHPAQAGAGAGAGDQVHRARAHRPHHRRSLSRRGRGAPGDGRQDQPRQIGADFGRTLVFGSLNYTKISDSVPPEEIIPLLNDYSEAVITAVHESGGNVLKLIGDGVLAIFKGEVPAETCSCGAQGRSTSARKTRHVE
jgi:adenylate cyclase